ncbi:MAG: phosphotransferase [Verrucomicrobia bacterium]|nr:phosphotransferase [Verrucomicrobiota bacterium]
MNIVFNTLATLLVITQALGASPLPVSLNIDSISLNTPTNRSFKLHVGGTPVFFRIGRSDADQIGIDRKREIENLRIGVQLGITPQLLGYELSNGLLMLEYIPGTTPTIEELPPLIDDVVHNFRALHSCKQNRAVEYTMFDKCYRWRETYNALDINKNDQELVDYWFSAVRSFEKGYYDGEETGVCHGDIYFGNILVAETGKVYFIDWEYSLYGYIVDDLGKFCSVLPHEQDLHKVVKAYWGSEDPQKLLKLQQNVFLHELAHYFWCYIQIHNNPNLASAYEQNIQRVSSCLNKMAANFLRQ